MARSNSEPPPEPFYPNLGHLPMNTTMAIWSDPEADISSGVLRSVD